MNYKNILKDKNSHTSQLMDKIRLNKNINN
jgi:hypothetical protein